VDVQGIFSEHSVDIPGIFSGHSVKIQGTSGDIQGIFSEHEVHIESTLSGHIGFGPKIVTRPVHDPCKQIYEEVRIPVR
jgi:hypothetical protein